MEIVNMNASEISSYIYKELSKFVRKNGICELKERMCYEYFKIEAHAIFNTNIRIIIVKRKASDAYITGNTRYKRKE